MSDKKYKVVCYMRVDPEDPEPMTMADAVKEMEHCEFLQPENVYKVELINENE